MNNRELTNLKNEMNNKKIELKQVQLRNRQEADLKMDKEIRKRVNDNILKELLDRTMYSEDPTIKSLYYQLKPYQNY